MCTRTGLDNVERIIFTLLWLRSLGNNVFENYTKKNLKWREFYTENVDLGLPKLNV